MKKKIIISLLIVIIFLAIIVYRNHNHSHNTTNTSTKKTPITYNYEISTDSNLKNAYIITSDKIDFDFKKYLVKENDTIQITIPKNKEFIISLHANQTIAAKWNLEYDSNILEFEKMEWIELNKNDIKDIKKIPIGHSTARQYFYFNSKNEGSEVLTFVYKHNTEDEQYFKFYVNIGVCDTNSR